MRDRVAYGSSDPNLNNRAHRYGNIKSISTWLLPQSLRNTENHSQCTASTLYTLVALVRALIVHRSLRFLGD